MGSGTSSDLHACTACGADLPTSAKFCNECGAPVSGVTERETRRTVTLLFCDVTGSTAMAEQLDPEAFRGVMGRYFEVARAAVERHGGTVEKFVGDAVLAVFGLPALHEDDALRAVRAARDLNDKVAELSDRLDADLGVRFAIRTGVNTGSVVTGSSRAGGSFATGDAVNTAARLEQGATPGEILLGTATYALVRDAVEVEAPRAVPAKGKAEPVLAYRLLEVYEAPYGRRRHEDAVLVGRMQEIRALDAAMEQTITSSRSHLVTVLGPPGIGKTRLIREFLTRVGERADVAQGRCVSYGQGITYWPLVQALRDALHLKGTESDETTRHTLEQGLGPSPECDDIVVALLPLLGKTGTPPGREQTAWAVQRLLEALAARRPLVLTIDDLHWAEPTLLELLERVRDEVADLPLLVLCQARPELLEQHPGWGSGALESLTFGLDPLAEGDIELSIAALLDGEAPDGLAAAVTLWSGGNPLFVEEILAHLIESGTLEQDVDDRWQVIGELARADVPPTVSAVLSSRLDRLPDAERDLIEGVSVIGLEFTTADAGLLFDDLERTELIALLARLTRRDLVRRTRSPQGDVWAFKHILIRDAAYDGLSKALRAELHERFADALLAGEDAGVGSELAGFVAHHLEQAAHYRRELGQGGDTEGLVERALDALVLAGDQARGEERLEDHAAYLQRALRLEPQRSALVRGILAGLADHDLDVDDVEQLGAVLDAFEAATDDTATDVDRAYLSTMRRLHDMLAGEAIDPAEVSRAAHELVASGREVHDTASVMRGLLVVSVCASMLGLWRDAGAGCDEIVARGSPAWSRAAHGIQGGALFYGDGTFRAHRDFVREQRRIVGRSPRQELLELVHDALFLASAAAPEAHDALDRASVRADELFAASKSHRPTFSALVDGFAMARDLDAAIAYAQRVSDERRSTGSWGYASTDILEQALLMLERGDPEGTVVPLVDEAEGYTSPYDVASVAYGTACRAILAIRAGDQARAIELTEDTFGTVDRTQETLPQANLRRWLSEVPRATGDAALERRLLLEAQERYHRKEIVSYDPEINQRLAELGP